MEDRCVYPNIGYEAAKEEHRLTIKQFRLRRKVQRLIGYADERRSPKTKKKYGKAS